MDVENAYPPIADYALISNCHCTALISRAGSVDWSCMPRPDSDSCFGRLLDWKKGGYCLIAPADGNVKVTRRYLPRTMVLETRFATGSGEAVLIDFFVMDAEASEQARNEHVRIVECLSGEMHLRAEVCARFDFGEILPHARKHEQGIYSAIGSNKGLLIRSDIDFEVRERHDLIGAFSLRAGERRRLVIQFEPPETIGEAAKPRPLSLIADEGYSSTCRWWQAWAQRIRVPYHLDDAVLRSAIVLKALTYESTGAIIAAPTTSLPEWIGESRNWDYRFSWVRDSVFTTRALYQLGYENEAERFLKFIQRASAGSAAQLQIMYGVDGKRRLYEFELGWLEGYRGSRPVRIGNDAAKQNQLDVYREILEIASMWDAAGHAIDPHYWDFLSDAANAVCGTWREPDYGIWEFRGGPRHYVHSKAMCWSALDKGIKLAQDNGFDAPLDHWRRTRDEIRQAIETEGYDKKRGIFVQAFGNGYLDSALLLLSRTGFVADDDARMMRTVDAVCAELDRGGLLLRYNSPDGLPGKEGVFLPCTFWLVACLARQQRQDEAWVYYKRALACGNDLGLFSEEYDPQERQMLGNFPQGLTHVSQIGARLALEKSKSS
jgi:GH15 family glucan-1,4-alpha-glucosidase